MSEQLMELPVVESAQSVEAEPDVRYFQRLAFEGLKKITENGGITRDQAANELRRIRAAHNGH